MHCKNVWVILTLSLLSQLQLALFVTTETMMEGLNICAVYNFGILSHSHLPAMLHINPRT